MEAQRNTFAEMAAINCSQYIEHKGKFSYLSWAWAVDQLLRRDENASWTYDEPKVFPDGTMMVFCTVKAFGRARKMQLPVMDSNKPIPNPDAFDVNTAMQRCLVKAIALHGIGLSIYAGEDVPRIEEAPAGLTKAEEDTVAALNTAAAEGSKALKAAWQALKVPVRERLRDKLDALKETAAKNDPAPVSEPEKVAA